MIINEIQNDIVNTLFLYSYVFNITYKQKITLYINTKFKIFKNITNDKSNIHFNINNCFFWNNRQKLLKTLNINSQIINDKPIISIHIDEKLNEDYYFKSLSMFNLLNYSIQVFGCLNILYLRFLDGLQYKLFNNNDEDNLLLMSQSNVIICSNYYSLWATYLNTNSESKFIVPNIFKDDVYNILPTFNYTCISDNDIYGFFNEKYILNYQTNDRLIVHQYNKLFKTNVNSDEIYYINNYFQTKFELNNLVKELNNDFNVQYGDSHLVYNLFNKKFYFEYDNKYEFIYFKKYINFIKNYIDKIVIKKIDKNNLELSKIKLHFTILILSYNNEKIVEKNLYSALNQKYDHFDILFIDCNSTDNTLKMAKKFSKKYTNIQFYKNDVRKYQTENFLIGTKLAKDNSIIVSLDGDDWLLNDNVLNILNFVYLSTNCNITYGSLTEHPRRDMLWNWRKMNFTIIDDIKKNKLTFSHLRTWKKELLLNIDNTNFLYDNEYPKMAGDISVMLPMFEKSINNISFIKKPLYVYNTKNNNSDCYINPELQIKISDYFYNKI